MELQVRKALMRTGESFPFRYEQELPPQEYHGRTLQFLSPAQVEGSYVYDGKGFAVAGNATVSFRSECARCLEPFSETLTFPFEERFARGEEAVPDGEKECYPYSGDTLALDAMFWDNLFLHLPLVSVCRPDCAGLCPTCGVNRNHAQCNCSNARADNPFMVLAALQHDNEEV